MTNKREVEEVVLSQIPTKDRSCGWPAFWRDIVVPYREKELIAALTKISQLEQQISAAEARTHAVEEELKRAMRALELACDDLGADPRLMDHWVKDFIDAARQDSAAEGGRG